MLSTPAPFARWTRKDSRRRWASAVALAGAWITLWLAGCAGRFGLGSAHESPVLTEDRPEAANIMPETLRLMEKRVQAAIDRGDTPGAVLYVAREGHLIEHAAIGNRSLGPPVPMTEDALFDLASVSKVMGTATAAMVLIEDGKMSLDTRVGDVIPAFAANGKENVTVRHLLTHSSGLKPYDDWKEAEKIRNGSTRDEALIARIASLPASYPTGENIWYSCLNFLTLARVNETVAGESQESLLRRRVWGPLGMNDTTYHLSPEQLARLAPTFKSYGKVEGKERDFGDIHDPLAYYYTDTDAHCSGNAGLFSTAHDMAIYCQMILNEGTYGDVRVFNPETVRMMTSVQAALPVYEGKDKPAGEVWHRGLGWGIPDGAPFAHPAAPPHSFLGHTGYTGTYLWLDKNSKSFVVLLANAVYSKDPPQMGKPRKEVVKLMVENIYGPLPEEPETKGKD